MQQIKSHLVFLSRWKVSITKLYQKHHANCVTWKLTVQDTCCFINRDFRLYTYFRCFEKSRQNLRPTFPSQISHKWSAVYLFEFYSLLVILTSNIWTESHSNTSLLMPVVNTDSEISPNFITSKSILVFRIINILFLLPFRPHYTDLFSYIWKIQVFFLKKILFARHGMMGQVDEWGPHFYNFFGVIFPVFSTFYCFFFARWAQ